MLRYSYDTQDEIPEAFRSLFKEVGGKWILQVEGVVPNSKLTEFRETNVELKKKIKALEDQVAAFDQEGYDRLKAIEEELEKKQHKGKDIDKLLEERVAKMKADHQKAMDKLTKEKEHAVGELSRLKISEAALSKAVELGLKPEAKDDLVARVSRIFKLDENGNPVATNAKGEEMFDEHSAPLTIAKHIESLVTEAKHLFQENSGTGAGNNGNKNTTSPGKNPFKKGADWNLSEQNLLINKDKVHAKRLANEAGITDTPWA